ncbi:ExeM/NucH family extracellular endonuclease [Corynebacterium frankenforstense]|uniref:ExeM/NucH family extracellular endonuclease n=1 Tax=Corynebacterium frankenforstense TaxID=1230998 RepID=UPI0039F14D50
MRRPLRRPVRRTVTAALTAAVTAAAGSIVVPQAVAAPDGSNVVINEVYSGGGNSGAEFNRDFVELFNPTDEPISVEGWTLDQQSTKGNSGTATTLTGEVPAGGHLLIAGDGGDNGEQLPGVDLEAGFNFAAKQAIAELTDASGEVVDLVGWGSAQNFEGAPAGATSNSTSVQRTEEGVDTDDNSADFTVGTPTPQASDDATEPGDDGNDGDDGSTPVEPGERVTAADVQGTGETTPLDGETVTVEGVVTAAYPEGGFDGFYLQDPGTGSEAPKSGDASHGLFVYTGSGKELPEVGASVAVTGTAGEHYGLTQIKATDVEPVEDLEPVVALEIDAVPAGDEAREAFEGMLVKPTGDMTVTGNYNLNQFGTVQLATGDEPYLQATEVHEPDTDADSPVQQLTEEQAEEVLVLDDGRSRNYLRGDQATPLPWIAQDDAQTIKSLRTGDAVDFAHPVVLDYRFDAWSLQPTAPVTGNTAGADLPITWEDSRPAALEAVDSVEGDYSIASFNVLNYFTSLGADHNCQSYDDREGNPVTARGCTVRGAYTAEAFGDQERKIVAAINRLDVDVLGLEEIENTYSVTGSKERRDEALARLVDALNAAGGNWAYVPSPEKTGTAEDVIRTAFIYNPDTVEPVGESRIFDDAAFTGLARQPLAQEFRPAGAGGSDDAAADDGAEGTESEGNDETDSFVAVVNHFKSKGSVANNDADSGDGQGNNPNVRARQAEALLKHLEEQEDWADTPTFILGDLNSYSKERTLAVLEHGGYTNIAEKHDAGISYQFSARLGSLDHALGNAAAMDRVVDAEVWDINADEPLAFEYSRRNYNVVDFYQDDPENIVFRASDHDPVKVGFNLKSSGSTDDPDNGQDPGDDGQDPGDGGKPGDDEPGDGSSGSSELSVGSSATLGVLGALIAVLGIGGIFVWAFQQFAPAELRDQIERLTGFRL